MSITTKGISLGNFTQQQRKKIGGIVNSELAKLEREAVKRSPAGVSGRLRQGWQLNPWDGLSASVTQNTAYYPFVEFGRKAGKGISREGQFAVARWAKLKLSLSNTDASRFAYNLSQKYKRRGRKAKPIIGVNEAGKPLSGQLLDRTFRAIDRRISSTL